MSTLRTEIHNLDPVVAGKIRDGYYKTIEGINTLSLAIGNTRCVYGSDLYGEHEKIKIILAMANTLRIGAVV